MALCAYHEDTQAVSICVTCKSDICGKCQDFGADGMCGMCLEMANARKASVQARAASAATAPARSGPLPPPPPRPGGAPGPTAARGPAGGPPKGAPAKATKATKGGFCALHDGQQLTSACLHCKKKVCPYCLDLYDHCDECRQLAHCSRHESMVATARCASCQLEYCNLCLANGEFCDRCRTLGMARVAAAKPGAKTRELEAKAARAGTGELDGKAIRRPPTDGLPKAPAMQPGGPGQPPARPGTRPNAGQPGHRPGTKSLAPAKQKRSASLTMAFAVGGLILFGIGGWVLFADHRPALNASEANAALRQEMELVRNAAEAVHQKTGKWPTSVDAVMTQIKAQGVDLKTVNPPLKLVVNGPAPEPLTVILTTTEETAAVRAQDAEGQPLADNGRDVVLFAPERKRGDGAPEASAEPEKRESGDGQP